MIFKFSTNFLLPYARKPAKYGGCGSTGLDATPTVQIHTGRPVDSFPLTYIFDGLYYISKTLSSKAAAVVDI